MDGGSTDDTLEIIKDFFKDLERIPGLKTVAIFEAVSGNTGSRKEVTVVSSPPPNRDEASDSLKKSCNADYPDERLVFESIINGAVSVKIYDAPGASISRGRNIAIKNAKSRIICVSDAGCRLSPNWLEEISKYFNAIPAKNAEDNAKSSYNLVTADTEGDANDADIADSGDSANIADNDGNANNGDNASNTDNLGNAGSADSEDNIVAGGYNFPYIENFLQACLAVCVLPVKSEVNPEKYMPSSRNISFTKAAWEKVGGYPQNMDFGEDMRFNFNLKSAGYKIMFNPDALVYWNLRNSIGSIFRQFFRYAKGDAVGRMYLHRHLIRFAAVILFAAFVLVSIFVSPYFLFAILLLFAAFIYRPYLRIKYFLNDKNCSVFTENKKTLLFTKLKIIFSIPLMLSCIETAKLAGFIYGLFIRKNFKV